MQHVSPNELQKAPPPTPVWIFIQGKEEEVEKRSEICVFVRVWLLSDCAKSCSCAIFKTEIRSGTKRKQSAFHMQACKTAQDALTWDQCRQQCKNGNINRPKGVRIWWIVVAVLSNAPFSTGLSFGTRHRGSNSSCQQQPFTYLSSQYISLHSIHFTSGNFVSPPLRFFHYLCVRLWDLCTNPLCVCAFVWVLSVFVRVCIHACVSAKKQNRIYTHVYPGCHGSLE